MNAAPCEGVCAGICVMLEDDMVVYAGPIKTVPNASGKLVLMSIADFEKFKAHIEAKRH